jgi:hypothetical protein
MHKSNQDYTAGRIQPSQFDCELPDDVRAQFVRPKRPRILERPLIPPELDQPLPVPKPESQAPFYWALLLCALTLTGAIYGSWRQGAAERARDKAISQPLAPQPTPAPGWRADGTAYGKAGVIGRRAAPRAELIKLPPPRAELVRLPEWRIGQTRPVLMPYNLEVLATYKGQLGSEAMLPQSGNLLGDMWVAGDTPWVWIWAPGAARADWIDP